MHQNVSQSCCQLEVYLRGRTHPIDPKGFTLKCIQTQLSKNSGVPLLLLYNTQKRVRVITRPHLQKPDQYHWLPVFERTQLAYSL